MFPTDKGISVSSEVSKVIEMIRNSGYSYKLGAMGTTIETDTMPQSLEILNKAYTILDRNSARIYSSVKFDIKKGPGGRLEAKTKSIENKIGEVSK
jgi:uncharacterized protein YqgV (UPF0045/DUF77 family)